MSTSKSTSQKSPESLTEKAREIWLAGLGVFSTIEEEGEKLFDRFIEKGRELEAKGETFEKKARDKVESITTYVTGRTNKLTDEVSAKFNEAIPAFDEKVQSVVEAFGVSSRKEVKALSDKVDKLMETVNRLNKHLEESQKTSAPKKSKG
jgi:poly(hydroxyalkanoate) granule-associated protein